jgi:membrane protease YdiL (CAAX protease family)
MNACATLCHMQPERLRASDYRFVAVCAALLAGTAWFSVKNFHRAFPEASIDFRVTRAEAETTAARFLAARGFRIGGYREASSFTFDDAAKTFLEREAGLERANAIMGTRVRLWRWSYRWFRPQQKEEFRVDMTPRGELAGFEHLLPEDAARPAMDPDAARSLAGSFLREQMGRDPASLDFVEVSNVTRPKRVDRVFTWKERDFNLKDATIRFEVTVLGNEIGGYREYLKIPEPWTRAYERLRSKNEMAQTIDMAVMLLLLAGLLVTIVLRVRRQDVRWRLAVLIGTVGVALSFCASLNQFPLSEFGYRTTDSYASFVSQQLLQAFVGALAAGGLLFVLAAGAEPLYREAFPGKLSLGGLLRPRGLGTKRFFLGAILGITLTGVFIAYQTGFYMAAYRFGAWSPADVPYSDLLNTRFPWLFVLFGGYCPAVSEEFLFRMFGITFLRKYARSTALAIVLAGFIWGFGHAGYPQQPFYIRGVEVGIGGVALGLVMLRWGILPTLVWHYSVDAMYSAMLLMRSGNLYFRLSGAASAGIVLLPVLVALVAYWRRGGFLPESGLLNADEPAPAGIAGAETEAAAQPSAETAAHRPLSARMRWAAAAVLGAALLSLLIPVSRFGGSPGYKLTSAQARAAAGGFLHARGLDPNGYRQVTWPGTHWDDSDSMAAKYFLERRPAGVVSRLLARYRPVRYWVTRYFKSLDVEGMLVAVDPQTGRVLGFSHTLPEDRPGADNPADAARALAASFATSQGWDVSAMDLKESRSEKKKARRDYTLVWEARPGDARNLDEARYRVEVGVAGDSVSSLRAYWKLPEAFERARLRQNWISISVLALRICAIVALVVWALWLLVENTRGGRVRWKQAVGLAAIPAALTLVAPLLSLPLMLQNYNTAIPLETFEAVMYTMLAMALVFAFLMLGASVALASSCYPESAAAFRAAYRRRLGLDAAVCAVVALGLQILSGRLAAVLMDRFHAQALFSFGGADLIASASPALAALADAPRSVLLDAAALAAIAVALGKAPRWVVWLAAPIAVFALVPFGIRTPGELALGYTIAAAGVAAAAAFCYCFARNNYLAYAAALWIAALYPRAAELFGAPNAALQFEAWIVAAAAAIGCLWAALPLFSRRPESAAAAR